jgi:hypothetical protein
MPTIRYRGPPMHLASMRADGVRSLLVSCELCRHKAVMNVDTFDDAIPVPAFGHAHGLHQLRDHRCILPTELAGANTAREPDWRTRALSSDSQCG